MSQPKLTNIIKSSPFTWKHLQDAVVVTAGLLALMWAVFLADELLQYSIKEHGLRPRTASGLVGILSMFFIHGSWEHIIHNSMGLMVLNTLLFYIYRKVAIPVFGIIFFLTPLLVWIFARPSNHIGASGVIYGLFGFLLFGGILSDNAILRRVTLVVVLYYGSLIWWIFPIKPEISWEGHLSGMIIGSACAFYFRDQLPKRSKYQFEMEPELPDDPDAYWLLPEQRKPKPEEPIKEETTVSVKYHYKPNE